MSTRMYVLVRRDLGETYRMVQGAHAVAEYSLRGDMNLYGMWNNSTVVFLGVRDEKELEKWSARLDAERVPRAEWREPDMDGQLTALAAVHDEHFFRKLRVA